MQKETSHQRAQRFGHSGISRGKILRLPTARERFLRADVDLRQGLSSADAVLDNEHFVEGVQSDEGKNGNTCVGTEMEAGHGLSASSVRNTDIDIAVVDRLSLEGVERYTSRILLQNQLSHLRFDCARFHQIKHGGATHLGRTGGMRNDPCLLKEAVNSARIHWALGYSAIQANSKWKRILKNRIGSGRQVKFLKTLALKVDNEIEARVRNDTLLKRWGSQLDDAYRNIPVGPALDYNLPALPALPTAGAMASAVAGAAQDSVGHDITSCSSVPGGSERNNTGSSSTSKSAHYDRRMVFNLQDADDVRRVCDEMDAEIEGRKIKKSKNQKLADNRAAALARGDQLTVAKLDKVRADRNARKAATRKRRAPIKKSIAKEPRERDARERK